MKNVLVLCTGNSCRSQMAQGFLSKYANGIANVYSAGVEVHGVNPKAIATMKEIGIDISGNTSNHIDEYESIPFDLILTVCDHALERCPIFPSKAFKIHHNFTDPSKLEGSQEEIAEAFRSTRDEIGAYSKELVEKYLVD